MAKRLAERAGDEATIQVIHAGLECGLLGAKIPGLDIVSFGPTIRGAHAPGEAVEVASVGRCWQLLTALLAAMRRMVLYILH
jgi:dipeptidase D